MPYQLILTQDLRNGFAPHLTDEKPMAPLKVTQLISKWPSLALVWRNSGDQSSGWWQKDWTWFRIILLMLQWKKAIGLFSYIKQKDVWAGISKDELSQAAECPWAARLVSEPKGGCQPRMLQVSAGLGQAGRVPCFSWTSLPHNSYLQWDEPMSSEPTSSFLRFQIIGNLSTPFALVS